MESFSSVGEDSRCTELERAEWSVPEKKGSFCARGWCDGSVSSRSSCSRRLKGLCCLEMGLERVLLSPTCSTAMSGRRLGREGAFFGRLYQLWCNTNTVLFVLEQAVIAEIRTGLLFFCVLRKERKVTTGCQQLRLGVSSQVFCSCLLLSMYVRSV